MNMRGVAGVQSVTSVSSQGKVFIAAFNEGNPRWAALPRSSDELTQGSNAFDPDNGMNTANCKAIQVLIYTKNHEGTTIAHIVDEIRRFAAENPTPNVAFRLAGGNVGVMAATNEAVGDAEIAMLLSIFGAIALLCAVTFRSWRAVLCIIVPLTLVSILCNAVMARLGIGLKVATLPVITLGVGVGSTTGSTCTSACSTTSATARRCRTPSPTRCASAARRRCSRPSRCSSASARGRSPR